MLTDPIANMLTGIRNTQALQKDHLYVPLSKVKVEILKVLKKEGKITDFNEEKISNRKMIKISFKYHGDIQPIKKIKRVSRPSLRVYVSFDKIPILLQGLGLVVISTSRGIMTGKDAKRKRLGGEIICEVY